MKIRITDKDRETAFSIPDGLLLNPITAHIAATSAARYIPEDGKLSSGDLRDLFAQVKAYQAKHGSWVLVEVCGADGRNVEIII